MSMEHLQEAFELIKKNEKYASFSGPRSEELIVLAEQRLGVRFPKTYRTFLLSFGAGAFRSTEFYGVIDSDFDNSSVPDCVWVTLNERRAYNMPNNIIAIGDVGDGDLYCLLLTKDEEAPVIIYQSNVPFPEQKIELIAVDFGAYLIERVKSALTY